MLFRQVRNQAADVLRKRLPRRFGRVRYRNVHQVIRPTERSVLPALVRKVGTVIDPFNITDNHLHSHLQPRHQRIQGRLFQAGERPQLPGGHFPFPGDGIHHHPLHPFRAILFLRPPPGHQFTIPPDSRERTLSTAEEFPVNDFSGIHHVHLPVPRAQGLPGKPAFPRCQVLDGETGNRVGKKRDDAQLPNGGKHRLRARHRCDREVRLFHFLRNFK